MGWTLGLVREGILGTRLASTRLTTGTTSFGHSRSRKYDVSWFIACEVLPRHATSVHETPASESPIFDILSERASVWSWSLLQYSLPVLISNVQQDRSAH